MRLYIISITIFISLNLYSFMRYRDYLSTILFSIIKINLFISNHHNYFKLLLVQTFSATE